MNAPAMNKNLELLNGNHAVACLALPQGTFDATANRNLAIECSVVSIDARHSHAVQPVDP